MNLLSFENLLLMRLLVWNAYLVLLWNRALAYPRALLPSGGPLSREFWQLTTPLTYGFPEFFFFFFYFIKLIGVAHVLIGSVGNRQQTIFLGLGKMIVWPWWRIGNRLIKYVWTFIVRFYHIQQLIRWHITQQPPRYTQDIETMLPQYWSTFFFMLAKHGMFQHWLNILCLTPTQFCFDVDPQLTQGENFVIISKF